MQWTIREQKERKGWTLSTKSDRCVSLREKEAEAKTLSVIEKRSADPMLTGMKRKKKGMEKEAT